VIERLGRSLFFDWKAFPGTKSVAILVFQPMPQRFDSAKPLTMLEKRSKYQDKRVEEDFTLAAWKAQFEGAQRETIGGHSIS